MVLATIDWSNPSTLSSIVTALLPVALGGVATYFKLFITPKEDLRKRVKLKKESLEEQAAMKLAELLRRVKRIADGTADLLRGDGYNEPDLVGEFIAENYRIFAILHRLELLKSCVHLAYYVLYLTTAIALLGLVAVLISDSMRFPVIIYSMCAVAVQVGTVCVMLGASTKLEQIEDVA